MVWTEAARLDESARVALMGPGSSSATRYDAAGKIVEQQLANPEPIKSTERATP